MSGTAVEMELLQSAVSGLPTDRLTPLRGAALARFSATGLPTVRHEDWKYTNLVGVAALSNAWLNNPANEVASKSPVPASPEITQHIAAHWIMVRNGNIDPGSLAACAQLAEQGVEISSLSSDEIGQEVHQSIDIEDPLSAFNAALLRDVLYIRVSNKAALDQPIGILHMDDGAAAVTQVRVLIDVAANARLQCVESAISTGQEQQFLNSVMQVSLAEGAALEMVRIQERATEHMNVNRMSARLAANAKLDYSNFDLGGSLARNDLIADIAGSGVSVKMRGLYLATDRQHIDNHTRVDHRVGPAISAADYRGILGGRSRCVFNGKAVVHVGADGTDANQSNHNLLLSEAAEIDTKPELEIYADDVKCSHGATVGQLDKTALFYLRSRGLDAEQAAQVLTRAFASVIPGQLPIAACSDYLAKAIDAKLDALINNESK